jgi:nucleotide-binding universal stress UspA family protein
MAQSLGFHNLLVPISDNAESERAMDVACRLAADRRASVAVVSVIEVPTVLPLDAHMTSEESAARHLVDRAVAIAEMCGVKPEPQLLRARDAAAAIVRQAELRKTELIVIGAPRKRRAAFGSTVEHVLKHAPCRVMVIGEAATAAAFAQSAAA